MSDKILLSQYLKEFGYELKRIKILWGPVQSLSSKEVFHRGFYATIEAICKQREEIESVTIWPELATTNNWIAYGIDCDDLIIRLLNYEDGAQQFVWSYAIYKGADIAMPSLGVEFDRRYHAYTTTRLSELFFQP